MSYDDYGDYDDYEPIDDEDYDDFSTEAELEAWYDDHLNPPGTEDCGDGYVDDDGVFYEY